MDPESIFFLKKFGSGEVLDKRPMFKVIVTLGEISEKEILSHNDVQEDRSELD
jgi:hypothetical protein